jgi:colicin import membrane protein
MARKLKTFVTNLGFFELAIAAPSMKAALEAWGMSHNAFQHGFAKQTDDPAIIAQTMAHPGTVLKRAVGSSGAFTENAALPKTLPNIEPPQQQRAEKKPKGRRPAKAKPEQDRAAILSFEAARKKRDKQRAEEEARAEAKAEKERAARKRDTDKAQAALDDALEAHERALAAIDKERDKLERQADQEKERWAEQREKLREKVERAPNGR